MNEVSTREKDPAQRGVNKLAVGCLVAVVLLAGLLVGGYYYFKHKFIEFIATQVHTQVVHQISTSALPSDQKKSLTAMADRLAADLKAGRIDLFDRKSLANAARNAVHDLVNPLDLPPDQKAGIIEQVDRIADAYQADRINDDQLGDIFDKLRDGPFAGGLAVWGLEASYVYGSPLSSDEQHDVSLQLHRTLHGYVEGKITTGDLSDEWNAITEPDPKDPKQRRMKPKLTAQELKDLTAKLKKLADGAGVDDTFYTVDFAAAMKKAVDDVMGPAALPAKPSSTPSNVPQ